MGKLPGIFGLNILLYDTFGDGWSNDVWLRISTMGQFINASHKQFRNESNVDEQYFMNFTVDCVMTLIEVCSRSGILELEIVSSMKPIRYPWEMMWMLVSLISQLAQR